MNRMEVKIPLAVVLLGLAAISRLLPHPANFAPMTAMALFTGAVAVPTGSALASLFISLWISDFLVNNILYGNYFGKIVFFYEGFYVQYLAYLLIFYLSRIFLREWKIFSMVITVFLSNFIFFLITNFGVFLTTDLYPHTWQGLGEAYLAAIPFWRNSLFGDMFYTAFLFGLTYLAAKQSWSKKFVILPK